MCNTRAQTAKTEKPARPSARVYTRTHTDEPAPDGVARFTGGWGFLYLAVGTARRLRVYTRCLAALCMFAVAEENLNQLSPIYPVPSIVPRLFALEQPLIPLVATSVASDRELSANSSRSAEPNPLHDDPIQRQARVLSLTNFTFVVTPIGVLIFRILHPENPNLSIAKPDTTGVLCPSQAEKRASANKRFKLSTAKGGGNDIASAVNYRLN